MNSYASRTLAIFLNRELLCNADLYCVYNNINLGKVLAKKKIILYQHTLRSYFYV